MLIDCLADTDMQEKVTEVDSNYASLQYESGSKCPAQPICRLTTLKALRAIDFLACVCVFPETTQIQRRAWMLPALFRISSPLGREDEG